VHFLERGKFAKSYDRTNYHLIEEELFGKLKFEAKSKIAHGI
jgi:hypothetical protein